MEGVSGVCSGSREPLHAPRAHAPAHVAQVTAGGACRQDQQRWHDVHVRQPPTRRVGAAAWTRRGGRGRGHCVLLRRCVW